MVLIVGPRLDRPSAVGEEGRPRATSLGAVTLLVVAYVAVVAEVLRLWAVVQPVAGGVGLVVVGAALVDREDAVAPFVGHLCFLPGGLLSLAAVASALRAGVWSAVLVAGVAIALFGVGSAWADAVGRGKLSSALEGGLVSTAVLLALVVTLPFTVGLGWLLWLVVEPTLLPGADPGLAGLLFLVGAAAFAVRIALGRLPLLALAARERRPALDRRLARQRRAATWLGVAALAGWAVVGTLELLELVPAVTDVLGPLGGVLVGMGPRLALGLVVVAALVAVAAAGAGRRLASLDAAAARRYAPFAGGIGLVALPLPILTVLLVGLASGSVGVVLLVALALLLVFVGTMLVLLALGLVVVAARTELLPDRAAPLALVSAGLFGVTVGGGAAGVPAPVTFAGVGAALFAWDVSEFGLGLTAELGHLPETRRVEVFHAVASAGVAVAGVAVAAALHALLGVVVPASFALPSAMVVAVLGTLVLLPALRG